MKFTDIRNSMQTFSGATTPEYQYSYLTTEFKDFLNQLNNQFVEHLTKDITDSELNIDLKNWLGSAYYPSANQNAKDCLEHCPRIMHIWGGKIKIWTDSALKCYDNFLLKYIQIDQGEKIPKFTARGKETDVYEYLIEKQGPAQKIGENFKYIYQSRSSFHHIQTETTSGIRISKTMSNSKYNQQRDLIIKWFREAVTEMMGLIETGGGKDK